MNISKHSIHHKIHLLGIEGMSSKDINQILNRSEYFLNIRKKKNKLDTLKGKLVINLFFESSTRTKASFEIAAKSLSAEVLNISVSNSSIKKGETLIDTASTLNAMKPDFLVLRHPNSGAAFVLSKHIESSIINAGDGRHEHPTQALLDAAVIRQNKGKIQDLNITICGDIANSRVARSNILLLKTLGAKVKIVAPPTLIPKEIDKMGVEVFTNLNDGLKKADIVMILRLQTERMSGTETPSRREFHHLYGINEEKLKVSSKDVLIMHPGPMNRGVEIDSLLADNNERSLISDQVEMGVSIRMACLEKLCEMRKSYIK